MKIFVDLDCSHYLHKAPPLLIVILIHHLVFHSLHIGTCSFTSLSLSNELEFYLRNNLQSVYDENQIESLDVLAW